jgi:hypothetical protein
MEWKVRTVLDDNDLLVQVPPVSMTRVVLVTPFPAMSDGLIMLLSVALVKVKRRMWMERNSNRKPSSQSSSGVHL